MPDTPGKRRGARDVPFGAPPTPGDLIRRELAGDYDFASTPADVSAAAQNRATGGVGAIEGPSGGHAPSAPPRSRESQRETKPKGFSTTVEHLRAEFDRYMRRWEKTKQEAKEDMKCLSMDGPWPDAERRARAAKGNERPCLHEDVISQYINQVVNQMEMNPMGISVQPQPGDQLQQDPANKQSAEFVENRIRQIEYEQNGTHAYLMAGQTAVESSLGYWEIETDWESPDSWKRCIKICSIMDPTQILPDPDAKKPDWSDMQGLFKISRMTHEEFRQKFTQAKIKSFEGMNSGDTSGWVDDQTVQVVIWWHIEKRKRNLLCLDDGTPTGMTLFEDELPPDLKKRRGVVVIGSNAYEQMGWPQGTKLAIIRESQRSTPKVLKTISNGVEVLDEIEWEDEEIPVLVVNGRVKYHNNEKVIESLTRKARTAQLLYDFLISAIQETINLTPKVKWIGYEGQFETNTEWGRLNRSPVAYAEAKATTEEVGDDKPLPLPQFVSYEPPIQALELAKQSILLSLQNAIGMSSVERKDRAAKSGKALESLQNEMNVATYHYFNSLRMAQLRSYRIINRLLEKVENTERDVALRDVKGNHSIQHIGDNHYSGRQHEVVIGSGKYYQDLQDKQEDTATELLSIKDPTVLLAVLPNAIRMKGLGPYGDELAKMIEAIQPAPMQQARMSGENGQQMPPEALQVVNAIKQQAGQQIQALNEHAKQLEQQVIELEDEARAKRDELEVKERMARDDNETKIAIATINASVKEDVNALNQQVAVIKRIADYLTSHFKIDADMANADMQRQHEQSLADQQTDASMMQAEQQRQHEAQMAAQQNTGAE